MSTAAITPTASARIPFTRVLLAGLIAIAGSVIANVIVLWLGVRLFNVPADFYPTMTIQPTIIFTTLFLVVATAVFAVINRFTANPIRVWTIVATIGLIVSLIPDFMLLINPAAMSTGMPMGTITLGGVAILILMHLVGFAIMMWAFTRWAPRG
jgi:hypothetical protein